MEPSSGDTIAWSRVAPLIHCKVSENYKGQHLVPKVNTTRVYHYWF